MFRLFFHIRILFLLALAAGGMAIVQAQTYWVGATSTNWGTASNWSPAAVPTSTTDVIIGDSHFTGTNQPTTNVNSTCRSLTVGVTKTATLTISSRLYCSGSITINSNGTISHTGAVDLRLTGNWSNSGTYNGTNASARVYFNGTGTQNLTGATTFRRLYIASGTTVLQNAITVNNRFQVNGGTFDPQTYYLTLTGATVTFSGGTVRVRTAVFSGNYSSNPGTIGTGNTIEFSGIIDQTIPVLNYSRITIVGPGTVKYLGGTITLQSSATTAGNITITSGTLDLQGNTANRGTQRTGGTLSVSSIGFLRIGGTGTFPTNYNTVTLSAGSTVEYYGNSAQNVSGRTYSNLIINKPGATATLAGNTTSSGTLTVSQGTLNISTRTLTASGNLIVNGTISGTGPIALSGATKTIDGAGSISSTGTITVSGGSKTILSTADLSIAGTIAVNTGITVTNNGTITTSASGGITGGSATATWVNAANSTLNISGPLLIAGTLNASGAPNTVKYNGTSAQVIKGTIYNNLIIEKTASTGTLDANATVNGDLTIASGTLSGSTYTLNVAGNIANSGTLTSTGLVQVTGNGSSVAGIGTYNFNDLTVSGAAVALNLPSGASIAGDLTVSGTGVTLNPTSNLTIGGDLAISGSGFLIPASSIVSIGGNIAMAGAGTLTANAGTISMTGSGRTISGSGISFNNFTVAGGGSVSDTSSFTVAGDFTASGSFTATAGVITLSGTSSSIIGGGSLTFSKLIVTGVLTTSSSFTVSSDLSVAGSLSASGGTITFTGTSSFSGTANLHSVTLNGTRLQLGANSVLGIANVLTILSGTLDLTTTTPTTVHYNASGDGSIASAVYDDLMLSNGCSRTAGGSLSVHGTLTITGATFNAGSSTDTIYGDIVNNGTFACGSSDVRLVGSADASITGAMAFNTLTVNKNSDNNIVTLNSNATVTNVAMTRGTLFTGSHSMTITGNRTGPSSIIGIIKRTNIAGGKYEFESPNNFIDFSSVTGIDTITVAVLTGPVADFPFGASVNREYDVVLSGSGISYSADLRLHYEDAELNGNIENVLNLWHNTGPTWSDSSKSSYDAVNNWVEKSGITDNLAGRWSLSDAISVARWTGAVSSNWNDVNNWRIAEGSPITPPDYTTIVTLGDTAFANPPVITGGSTVKSITFGSVQSVTLSVASGTLTVNGNIGGTWSGSATHTIDVGANSLTVGGNATLSDGTSGHSINLLSSGAITINGSLTQTGDASISLVAGTLTIGGNFTRQSGSPFSAGTSTATYNGSGAQRVGGNSISYNNLVLNKPSGTATLSSPATVTGSLTLSTGGTFDVNATLTVDGDVTVNSGATLDGSTSTINVGGSWTKNGGGIFISDSGTVIFNGIGGRTISASMFNNLVIDNAAILASLGGDIQINGNLSINNGTLDLGLHTANRSVFGGTLALSVLSSLKVAGTNNFPANYATNSLATSSTVEYNGTGAQIVTPAAYGNLIFTNGGSNLKSLNGSTTVNGDLTINSGATLYAGSNSLSLAGNWTNNGSYTEATSTVSLTGSTRIVSGATATTFYNLNVPGNYTFQSQSSILGLLKITGTLDAGATSVTVAGDLASSGTFNSSGTVTFSGSAVRTLALNSGFVSTGTVEFDGTFAPALSSSSVPTFKDVIINNSAGVAPDIGWTVGGTFTVNSGKVFNGGSLTHIFRGSFTNNGAVTNNGSFVFNPSGGVTIVFLGTGVPSPSFTGTGSVELGGTGAIFISGGATFTDLLISNTYPTGIAAGSSTWTINRDFTISSGSILDAGSCNLTLYGDLTNLGTFDGNSSTTTIADTTIISGAGSTVFNNLTVNASALASAAANITVQGILTNNGTVMNNGTTTTIQGAFSNNGTVTNTGTVLFSPTGPIAVQLLGVAFYDSGTVNFGGTGQIAFSPSSPIFNNLVISNTYGITPASNWAINGDVTVQPGGIFNGGTSLSHTFGGDFNVNGTFDGGSSTITFSDPTHVNKTINVSGSVAFNNLIVAASDSLTAASDIAVQGNLTNNGTFNNDGVSIAFSGTSSSIIGGAINPQQFDQIVVSKAGTGTLQLGVEIDSVSALTVNSGTLDGNNQIIRPAAGGVFTLAPAAAFRTGNTADPNAFPSFATYAFDSLSTVEYNGSGNQTISVVPLYGSLILSGGTATAGGALKIARNLIFSGTTFTPGSNQHSIGGNFSITSGSVGAPNSFNIGGDYLQSGGTFNGGILSVKGNFSLSGGAFIPGANTDTIGGNWTMMGGSFTNAGSTMVFSGSGSQTIGSSGPFNTINVNKAGGSLALSGSVTATTLNLVNGRIQTGSDTLIIASGGSVNGANSSRYVIGYLQKTFTAASPDQGFEIGDAASYAPASVSFSGVAGSVVVTSSTVSGDHPSIGTSGILADKTVNRYWRVLRTGGSFTNYSAAFSFVPADIDAGSNPATFIIKRYSASNWDTTIIGTRTSTSTQATGITGFGDFQIGEVGKYWIGPPNGNWGTPANWNPAGAPIVTDHIVLNGADTIQIDVAAVCDDFTMTSSSAKVTILPARSLTTTGFFAISAGAFITQNEFPSVGGAINLAGGTFGYDGTGAQTIAAAGYYNLSITGSRGANSVIFSPADTIRIAEVFNPAATFTSGNYIASNTIFKFEGASGQIIPGFVYNRLVVANGARKVAGGDITVTGSLATLSSADTLDFGLNAFVATGASIANTGVLMSQGNVILGSGATVNGTFVYNAMSGTQTIANVTYTGGLVLGGAASKTIGNITIGNSYAAAGGARTYTGCVTYNRAGSQSIAPEPYNKLALGGSGVKIFSGLTSIGDTLRASVPVRIASGTTSLGANGFAIFSDSLMVDGTFDAAAGSNAVAIFDGGAQVITGSAAGIAFRNLILTGAAAKFSSVNISVSGTFTPTRGLSLGSTDTLFITNNSAGAVAPFGAGEEVIGCVQRAVTPAGWYRMNNDSTSVSFNGGAPISFVLRVDSCTNPYGYTATGHVNRRIFAGYSAWTSGKATLKIGYRYCERPSLNENKLRMLKSDGVANCKKMVTGISTARAASTPAAFGSLTLAGISPGTGYGADSVLPNGACIILSNEGTAFLSLADADWNSGSTWDEGTVPTSDDDVTIRHNVSISAAAFAASVVVNGGKTLTLANGNLTVQQGLINSVGASMTVAGGRMLQVAASGTGPLYNLGSIINRGTIRTGDADSLGQIDNSNGVLQLRCLNTGKPDTIRGSVGLYGDNQAIPAKYYQHLVLSGSGTDTTTGGSFTVSGNLTVAPTSVLSIEGGSILTLGDTLFEQGYVRGRIRKLQFLGSASGSSDFGRIGSALAWTNRSPDTTLVTRTSGIASGNSLQSILRYYEIAPKVNARLDAVLNFKYSANELNSNRPKSLELWRSTDNGATWRRQGGTVDTLQRIVTKAGVTQFSRWTAADTSRLLGPSAYEWVPDSVQRDENSNNQVAYRRTALQKRLRARLKDYYGNWLERDTVNFGFEGNSYGATLSPVQAVTDSDGYASTVLTLGDSLGMYTVIASNPRNPGRNVRFTATAVISRTAAATRMISGNNQPPAPILSSLSAFIIGVIDSASAPVPGVPVQFALDTLPAHASGQLLSDTIAYTDMSGHASTILTLGNKIGTYRVKATAGGLPGASLLFTARAIAGPPNASVLFSGGNQIKQIGDTLDEPIVISVVDVGTNPVAEIKVAFAVESAPDGAHNSFLTADSAFTDSLGRASVRFIVGTQPGTYSVAATVPGLQPVICTARGFLLSGDANSDEALNIADITAIISRLNGRKIFSELDSIRADIDTNGTIDVRDIAVIDSCILNEIVFSDSGSTVQSKYASGARPASHAGVNGNGPMKEISVVQAPSMSGALEVTVNGLRLNLSNSIPVTGVQLDATFKQNVHIDAPELLFERMRGMHVETRLNGTKLHLLAYNFTNAPIAVCDSIHTTLLRLPLYLMGVAQIDTAQIIVSTVDDQAISFPAAKTLALPGLTYPAYYKLYQNYPNPFNSSTTIRFDIPDIQGRFARIQIQIFDILGREVKTLFLGDVEAGPHSVTWNGTDHSGKPMPSGIYFYRLLAREHVSVKKIIYIK